MIEKQFLFSGTRHEEVVDFLRGLDTRGSNLEDRFDEQFGNNNKDNMSEDFQGKLIVLLFKLFVSIVLLFYYMNYKIYREPISLVFLFFLRFSNLGEVLSYAIFF